MFEDNNFKDQIMLIIQQFPDVAKQIFTATLAKELEMDIKSKWFKNKQVTTVRVDLNLKNYHHIFFKSNANEKLKLQMLEAVFELDCYSDGFKAIVFCEKRRGVDETCATITKLGYACSKQHGGMDEKEKREEFAKFMSGKSKVLICSDMMSRGINVESLALVVNYDIPKSKLPNGEMGVNPITYIHRTGRSGRFGRKGVSLTIVNSKQDDDDFQKVSSFAKKKYETEFEEVTLKNMADKVK